MVEKEEKESLKRGIAEQVNVMKGRGAPKSMAPFYKAAERMLDIPESPSVGYMCEFVPIELITAAGATPFRMCTGTQETTFRAEEYLPQSFCPLVKSTMGFFREDADFDLVVIPATCDGRRHLGELFGDDVRVHVMDVPATGETIQSRELWYQEVLRLKKVIEKATKKKITAKKLRASIDRENQKRDLLKQLYEPRTGDFQLAGSDLMLMVQLSHVMSTDEWIGHVRKVIAETTSGSAKRKKGKTWGDDQPRILLSGSPVIMPNWKIPLLIEESGGALVVDNLCSASRVMWIRAEPAGSSMQELMLSIAERQLMSLCPCQIPFEPAWLRLKALIEDYRIDGIVHHVLQSCHLFGVESALMRSELDKMGVSLLALETDYSQEDVEQLRTRIEAFLEMIEARMER